MRVAEIYHSVQGEGFLTGTPSAFVRASGCNLRCTFCDTPYASWTPEGDDLSVEEIAEQVLGWPSQHVVITGGEPMLFAELIPLTDILHQAKRHITIETAGTLYLPVTCDLMSISPKLSNSTPSLDRAGGWHVRHERVREAPDVIRRLVADYPHQVKFVVGSPADAQEVLDYLAAACPIDRSRVQLMPLGTEQATLQTIGSWLESFCQEHGLLFCPRKQIEWFGLVRGT